MDLLLIMLGVGFLYAGGEGLVRGASALGRRLGLSPVVIGLTIVSLGTSSPELAATLAGVLKDLPAVSFGNVVGSNIANLALVLGITSAIWPLAVSAKFLNRDVPFMLLTSALLFPMVWDRSISRLDGALMLLIMALYLRHILTRTEESAEVTAEFAQEYGTRGTPPGRSLTMIVVGIAALVLGAHLLIQGAVGIARVLGISERVIGLTMVAFGTSLPELASSIVAALRREGDIVLGNLIGSNIFNVLFILGLTSVIKPVAIVAQGVWLDLLVMMGVSILVWLFLTTQSRLTRWEGGLLILIYVAYMTYLFV